MFDAAPGALAPASAPLPPPPGLAARRRRRGRAAGRIGRAAEDRAMRLYLDRGWRLAERNWRADRLHGNGELDLVFTGPRGCLFVEVKARRTLEEAAYAVTPAQRARMEAAALRWMDLHGFHGGDMRLDLALFDRQGRMEVMENAFA